MIDAMVSPSTLPSVVYTYIPCNIHNGIDSGSTTVVCYSELCMCVNTMLMCDCGLRTM